MELFIVVEKKLIKKFEEIKEVLEKDYEENKEPSNEFINTFAKNIWVMSAQ